MVSGARSPRRNRTAASDSSRWRIAVIAVRLPGPGSALAAPRDEVTTTRWPSVSASAGAGWSNIASVTRIVDARRGVRMPSCAEVAARRGQHRRGGRRRSRAASCRRGPPPAGRAAGRARRAGHVDVAVRQRQDLVLGAHRRAEPGQPRLRGLGRRLHDRVEVVEVERAVGGRSPGPPSGSRWVSRSACRPRTAGSLGGLVLAVLLARPAGWARASGAGCRRRAGVRRRSGPGRRPRSRCGRRSWPRSRPASGAGRPGERVLVQRRRSSSEPSSV